MTQEEKRALIATEVMGWRVGDFGTSWLDKDDVLMCWRREQGQPHTATPFWKPDELRDQLAEVEAALSEEQHDLYSRWLHRWADKQVSGYQYYGICWLIRTAPPADCVDAIVEMLGGDREVAVAYRRLGGKA